MNTSVPSVLGPDTSSTADDGTVALLERIARGDAAHVVLDSLARLVEARVPGVRASIMIVESGRLRHGAAPGLPSAYARAIDGTLLAPNAAAPGSRDRLHVCEDVGTDPRWREWRSVAERHGLRASWAVPVTSAEGALLAVLAAYGDTPSAPTASERDVLRTTAHLASLVVERDRRNHALARAEAKYRTLSRTMDEAYCVVKVLVDDRNRPVDFRFTEANPAYAAVTGLGDVEGRWVRELVPEPDAATWIADCGRVALEGAPLRIERRSSRSGRLFACTAFPVGAPGEGLVAQLVRDVTHEREIGELLERGAERIRSLADAAPTVLWVSDAANDTTFMSRAWHEETGQPLDESLGLGWLDVVHPEDRGALLQEWHAAVAARTPYSIDFRARRRDGEHRWANTTGNPHHDADGRWLGYVGHVVDIHDRVVQARQLQRMAEFRRSTMTMIEEGLEAKDASELYDRIVARAVGVIPGAQAGAVLVREEDGLFGYAAVRGYDLRALRSVRLPEEAAGFGQCWRDRKPRILVRPRTHATVQSDDRHTLEVVGLSESIESVLVVPISVNGSVAAYLTLDNLDDVDAFGDEALEMARVFAGHVGSLVKRFSLERDLHRMAYEDSLTGVPNRAHLMEHLRDELARAAAAGTQVALLFVDLDDLKPVNDSLGHPAGDEVLRTVAARLQACATDGAFLARMSGDEFTFVVTGSEVRSTARSLARAAQRALAPSIHLDGHDVHISASMGISVYPDDGEDASDILRHADIAMLHTKQAGKNGATEFTAEMGAAPLERLMLEEALRAALDRDEFVLHYQPRVDLRTGKVLSLEALVRWEHPQRGTIPPGLFVPLAEATDLIHPLGKRILEMAARQARTWRDAGYDDVRVAVNLSARQLERPDLVREIRDVLAAADVPASAMEIEILESVAMKDVRASAEKLALLKELGVIIALDDFGTGYSSLAYLQQLPLDLLKIDRSFLTGTADDAISAANRGILEAVLALGRTFGLHVVAEGVETEEQLTHLRAMGCHEAQGFHLSRPVPAQEVEALLARPRLVVPREQP